MIMSDSQKINYCLNCNTSENEIPLVNLVFARKPAFICSSCLPVLIHQPQKLVGKLEGADKILPAKQDH
jgi:hypothetical protein